MHSLGLEELREHLATGFSAVPHSHKVVLGVAATAISVFAVAKVVKSSLRKKRLNVIVARRRAEREASIEFAEHCASRLSHERRELITAMNFDELREALQTGAVSPTEALHAYYGLALRAHERTNCVTLFIKEAETWALDLEKNAPAAGARPPLFGLPVSLKECVPVKGYDVTRGYVNECFAPVQQDCIMVQQLKALGAVPFVQTNVPQSLLAYSCFNPIYGETCHPDHKERTSGGSSGGESALIASGGSLLGIGGDVGGSIRFPCHFCGLAGIKPSHTRFSSRGVAGSVPGRPLINASDGPMAVDVHTCVEFLRAVWADDFIHRRDAYAAPVPWNEKLFAKGRPLTIGYYLDDGWFTPTPALQRAVLEAKAILESRGYSVVPFRPPRIPEVFSMFVGAVCVDGGRYLISKMGEDLMDPRYGAMLSLYKLPFVVQSIAAFFLRFVYPRMAAALTAMPHTTSDLRRKYASIEDYRFEFLAAMESAGVDAILCPAAVIAAPHHDVPVKLFAGVTYTGTYNLLDFAAGTVPVTHIKDEDDEKLRAEYPTSDPWYRIAKQTMTGALGLPVGVQVTAPPFREEVVLRVMQEIENSLKHTDY